jgi:hypothetical protein
MIVLCAALTALSASTARADPVLYAAGDIACDPGDADFNDGSGTATRCAQGRISDLVLSHLAPGDSVLALGDVQYDVATLSNLQQVYDPTWGRFKGQTTPVIGNHEGTTATSAAAYCTYFGATARCNPSGRQGGAAFYSFDVGSWHVVVLNSNCAAAGGCGTSSPQYRWLAADLAANPRTCTLAAWHHPRWSSGYEGSNASMQPIWKLLYDNGGDLVLSGHSHDYERFAPIDGHGSVDRADGMREFVVGTGGVNFTAWLSGPIKGTEVRQNTTFGVLQLVLHPTSYDWRFLPEPGRPFSDSGSQGCRGDVVPVAPPPAAPPPPVSPQLRATLAAHRTVKLRTVLRRGILLRVTSNQNGQIAARGLVGRRVGRRLRMGRTLLRGSGTAIAGRRTTVRLTVSKKAARALRRAFSPGRRGRAPRKRLRVRVTAMVRTASATARVTRLATIRR